MNPTLREKRCQTGVGDLVSWECVVLSLKEYFEGIQKIGNRIR